jgi:hypothetical protein
MLRSKSAGFELNAVNYRSGSAAAAWYAEDVYDALNGKRAVKPLVRI